MKSRLLAEVAARRAAGREVLQALQAPRRRERWLAASRDGHRWFDEALADRAILLEKNFTQTALLLNTRREFILLVPEYHLLLADF